MEFKSHLRIINPKCGEGIREAKMFMYICLLMADIKNRNDVSTQLSIPKRVHELFRFTPLQFSTYETTIFAIFAFRLFDQKTNLLRHRILISVSCQ